MVSDSDKCVSILLTTISADVVNHSVYCIFYIKKDAEKVALSICVKIILGDNYERNTITNQRKCP
jgi:predicted DNA-binding helix-hairpin-helix protein